jgi:hypothetical protein
MLFFFLSGAVVSVLVIAPKVRGFVPGRAIKIRSTPSFEGE